MSRKKTPSPKIKLYFMMNKASGTVCSTVSDRRKTVYEAFCKEELVSPEGAKLHSVGRLDADTEGLLLFTNDGKFSNFLTRPESNVPKKYFVRLKNGVPIEKNGNGLNQAECIEKALTGLILPAEKKAPEQQTSGAKIEFIKTDEKVSSECYITVTEGKFHEVKRIFLALGNEVVYLKRVSFGGLELDEKLCSGEFRALTSDEILLLCKTGKGMEAL